MLKYDKNKNKALATMKGYDEKLQKAQEELQKLQDKKDNFYMVTVANTLKSHNISLPMFFDYLDMIIGDIKEKGKKTGAELGRMDTAAEKRGNPAEVTSKTQI